MPLNVKLAFPTYSKKEVDKLARLDKFYDVILGDQRRTASDQKSVTVRRNRGERKRDYTPRFTLTLSRPSAPGSRRMLRREGGRGGGGHVANREVNFRSL